MQDRPEAATAGNDQVAKAKAEVKQEIDKAREPATKPAAEVSAAEKALAQKLLNELSEKATAAREVRDVNKATGGLSIESKRKESVAVKVALVKVLEAVKEGIITPPAKTKVILSELAERAGRLTDTSASYLQPLLEKYISRELTFSKADQEPTQFEKDFRQLNKDNPSAAQLLGQILYDKVGELGDITKDDLQRQLGLNVDEEGKVKIPEEEETSKAPSERTNRRDRRPEETPEGREEYIEIIKREQFDLYLTDKDKEFLKAIYYKEEFVNYIEKMKNAAKEKGAKDDREGYEKASKVIEDKLIEVIDKILARYTETSPEKYWEQVAQENFLRGIQTTLATFGSYLDRLKTGLEEYEHDNPDIAASLYLYKSVGLEPIKEDILIEYKDERGKNVYVDKPRVRYKPLSKPEKVSLSGFASYMRLMVDEYIGEREYLHNARSILTHPKDPQQGFYAVLGNYAEKMKTPAIEEMFMFPNADLLQDAINLYDKYVDEQFASQDWQHTPDMFLPRTGTVLTRLEEEVIQALKKMHPEIKEESKLKSALFMAIGAHRGIFMTEEEKAAFADPRLTPEGKATYTSYYTNDTDPLIPLNPAHHFWRWQAERSIPLWLFLPVEGYSPLSGTGTVGAWDHRSLWENMKKYKESFYKGRDKMIENPLLIDFMLDIANVGGPSKRRGWRIYYTTEGHFVFKEEKDKTTGKLKPTGKVDVLKTWQAIENIGYELCYDFVFIRRAGTGFLQAEYESSPEKKEFFKYLYANYFISDPKKFNEADLRSFLGGLEGQARNMAELKLKRGLVTRDKFDAQVEEERSNLFLSETLARLVVKRFPSKILRIDRDRFSKEHKSRWNKVREEMGMSSVEFDKVMKNLCLAEALLRKDVSAKMKENIKKYAREKGKNLEDIDVGFHLDEVREGLDFRLTKEKITKYLSENNRVTADELDKVIKLYETLQKDYIGENRESQEFLRSFSKYINPNITEEGSYTFTFGLDDTDMSLVAFRGAGGRLIARALKDTAHAEKNAVGEILELNDKLHAAAVDGKHDFSEIVGSITKIRNTLVDLHGTDYAQKVAHHLSLAVINFFKKDTVSRNMLTKWLVVGQPHSLAAEVYGGAFGNVWEWDVGTIDQFIFALRRTRALPQLPYDPAGGLPYEWQDVEVSLFGKKIKLGKRRVPKAADSAWYEGSLRRDAGAQGIHKVWEALNTILPLFLIWLIWKYFKEAYDESTGKKK